MTITLTREEAQQVLDALEYTADYDTSIILQKAAIETLRARLSAPESEPVAYLCENAVGHKYFRWKKPQSIFKPIALYTTPPQRKEWVGLTDEEINEIGSDAWVGWPSYDGEFIEIYRLLETKLKEKNG